jgi:hypothetical protein
LQINLNFGVTNGADNVVAAGTPFYDRGIGSVDHWPGNTSARAARRRKASPSITALNTYRGKCLQYRV